MSDLLKMSIQDLGKLKEDLLTKIEGINKKAEAEARDLTDAENTEVNEAFASAEQADTIIKARNGAQNRYAKLNSLRGTDTGTTVPATRTSNVEVGEPRWMSDPAKGFKNHKDFFAAVMANSRQVSDERLKYLNAVGSDEHSTSNDPYGGFFVPEGLMPGLMTVQPDADPIAGLVQSVPMATPIVHINARVDKNHTTSVSGGLRVYRRAEMNDVTSSRMETEQIRLQAEGLMGASFVTEELMQDSPISVAALISTGFNDEFVSRILSERIGGTGVGQFEGIKNSPALITVAKETGQAADTITYENLLNMFSRMWRPAQAVWIANQTVIPQLGKLNQTVGTAGVPAWQPSARDGMPSTIFGRPVIFTEYCEALGDLGDIYFANWSQYLEGTYQGVQGAESIHVRFLENERTFKFLMRNDGRSWWRSTLTPRKGVELSPFVTLAARA